MTITVEDGTIVTDANSYVSVADLITYASARGVTISEAEAPVLITKAMDYIETRLFQGQRTTSTDPLTWPTSQALSFPRDYVYIEGALLDDDAIPIQLINAECQLCMDLKSNYDPLGVVTRAVKEEQFAVFKKVYMDNAGDAPILQKVNAWLDPLLESSGGGHNFRLERSYG